MPARVLKAGPVGPSPVREEQEANPWVPTWCCSNGREHTAQSEQAYRQCITISRKNPSNPDIFKSSPQSPSSLANKLFQKFRIFLPVSHCWFCRLLIQNGQGSVLQKSFSINKQQFDGSIFQNFQICQTYFQVKFSKTHNALLDHVAFLLVVSVCLVFKNYSLRQSSTFQQDF